MVDKVLTVPRSRARVRMGTLSNSDLASLDLALLLFLGLASPSD